MNKRIIQHQPKYVTNNKEFNKNDIQQKTEHAYGQRHTHKAICVGVVAFDCDYIYISVKCKSSNDEVKRIEHKDMNIISML